MAKNWTLIYSNSTLTNDTETPQERNYRFRKADNLIRKTQPLSSKDLYKEGTVLYEQQENKNANLISAYEKGILKSKKLKKKAENLLKEKENKQVV